MKSEADIGRWYDNHYKESGDSILRPEEAYLHILDYFELKKGNKLLDIGCGAGWVLKDAQQRELEAFGIELSEEVIKIAKVNAPHASISIGSALNLDFPDKHFDNITCIGVLEHTVDIDKSLQEMYRTVKNDGDLCILIPNSNFIYWKATKNYGTGQQEINEQMFTLNQWKQIFLKNGFKTCSIHRDLYLTKKTNSWVKKLILYLLPKYWSYAFYFILKKDIK